MLYFANIATLITQTNTTPSDVNFSFLPILLGGYGALGVIGIINAIFSVIAAVHAFQGKLYHYPLLGWLAV